MDLDLVLPGHGDPITEHRELIDRRFELHRRRADKIQRLLDERSRSAYEIAQALWGNVAVTQAYLTLSEVLGHLDLLTNAGRAREQRQDGRSLFEALPAASFLSELAQTGQSPQRRLSLALYSRAPQLSHVH